MELDWKESARMFFLSRAATVSGVPSMADLCYVSGKDHRLWNDEKRYQDLMESIAVQLALDRQISLLEVGCAAGFLARGVAPMVGQYTGLDVASEPLKVARRLELSNATFKTGDGLSLPFPNSSFDRVLCYDVLNNFPDVGHFRAIALEMLRVLKPGGKMLVGAVPDKNFDRRTTEIVARLGEELSAKHGPPQGERELGIFPRLRNLFYWQVKKIKPAIVCYSFQRGDFLRLGDEMNVQTRIEEIHQLNPYYGCRFNVVYTKDEH